MLRPLLIIVIAGALLPAQPKQGYYRFPSLHDKTIVFTAEGDLWTGSTEGGAARRLTSHQGQETNAAISPDGKLVAFTAEYEGPNEVYVMPAEGGLPVRRTWEGGNALVAGWTPDGRVLYTTSRHSTLPNAQLVAIDSAGKKELLPLSQAAEGGYDDKGATLFFTRLQFQGSQTKRYKGGTAQNIWRFTSGAEAVPLTKDYPGTSRKPMWWNGRVYFLSDRDGTMNIWSMLPDAKDLRQHTKHRGIDAASPSLHAGRIAYQYGADICVLDIRSGRNAAVPITLVSDFDHMRERWVKRPIEYLTSGHISNDGKAVVFTARGQVFVVPAKEGRLVTVAAKPGVRYRNARMMPDGKSVIVLSTESGELEFYKFPANGVGEPERLTNDGKVLRWDGIPSPDGNWIAHHDKDWQLWIYDVRQKTNKMIAKSPMNGGFGDLEWSPDSKWLAYAEQALNTFTQLRVYSVDDGTITTLTSDRYNSRSPAWSRDGKWLYFLSDRALRSSVMSPWGPRQPDPHFDRTMRIYEMALKKGLRSVFEEPNELHPAEPPKPEPPKPEAAKAEAPKPDAAKPEAKVTVTIDQTNIMARVKQLPVPPGNYSDLTVMTKRLCWTDSDRSSMPPKTNLQCIEPGHKPEVETVMSGIQGYELSGDGKKFLVRRGEEFLVLDSSVKASALNAPKAIADARVSLSDWTFPVKPRDEFRELFMDAWRLERDYFYDKNMHGVDWRAMRDKYMPLVDRVTDRAELNDLIAQMVAELSALHIFVRGGDVRRGQDQVQIASLGAQLERDQAAGGYRVVHIYRNDLDLPEDQSPLAKPGVDVAEGDVITHVDGVTVLSEPDMGALLRGKAGKQVLLRVGKRDVVVRPIALNQDGDLRYSEWEYTRRLEVDKMSGGRIGYVHLRAMGPNDISQFVRDYYPVFNRDGLIIDVRHNNGGNIDSWLLGKLMRKPWFYWQPREGASYWNMQYAFRGHMVVLVDERTASDGEAFAEGFKRLGLGKVIGTRTWGGEIWLSSSNFLADRGIATAAETGVYGPEGKWLIEGHGVDPDIVVDNPPHETFKGRDAQLEAAVKHLEALIAKEPRAVPPSPKHPDKSFKY